MNENILSVEQNIDDLLSTGFGDKHNVAVSISQIDELEYRAYDDLSVDMISGKVIVRQAPGRADA